MLRSLIVGAALVASPCPVVADVWMVTSSGVIACKSRDATADAMATRGMESQRSIHPSGCVVLNVGERLLDQPEVGVGFNDQMRVQRHDGSTVFVPSAAVAPDPGIGSIMDDRPE